MSLRKDRVRVLALLRKREDISQDEFHRYWIGVHLKVFTSIAVVKKDLTKYEQLHKNHEFCEAVEKMGFSIPQWDGIALFEAESFEKILAIFDDEEYKRVVIPDELKFIDRPNCMFFPVNFATIFERESPK